MYPSAPTARQLPKIAVDRCLIARLRRNGGPTGVTVVLKLRNYIFASDLIVIGFLGLVYRLVRGRPLPSPHPSL